MLQLIFSFALLIWGAACPVAAHDPEPLTSTYIATPPEVDGDLSDWNTANFILVEPKNGIFDAESATTDDPADQSFSFGVANDDEYLYVAVMIVDDILVVDSNKDPVDKDARAWMDDTVEIFLDGDHSHSPDGRDTAGVEYKTGGEFAIVANGATTSTYSGFPLTSGDPEFWTSAASYAAPPAPAYQAPWDTEVKGFSIEARINYRIMGEDIGPGSTIGFTVSAHDDDDGGGRDTALYWKAYSPSGWKNEEGWGDLILSTPTAIQKTSFARTKAAVIDSQKSKEFLTK